MRPSPVLLVPALVLVLSGCSEAQEAVDAVGDTAGKVQDCAGLARDVASAGLSRVPSQADAQAAKERLDARVDEIGDQSVREAAGALSDRLGELTAALRSTDRTEVQATLVEVRDAAREAAGACNIPVGQLLP